MATGVVTVASIRLGDDFAIIADRESPQIGCVDTCSHGFDATVAEYGLANPAVEAAELAAEAGIATYTRRDVFGRLGQRVLDAGHSTRVGCPDAVVNGAIANLSPAEHVERNVLLAH